jgi:uncharacterized protein YecE (DUF72 family)
MIYLGTSGFKYEEWKGNFYPSGLAEKEWLPFYARHFNALEINSTYYRLMHPATFYHMARKVPEGFCFTVKAYRTITHEIDQGDEGDLSSFLNSLHPLQEANKLGCLVAQFPNSFRRSPRTLSYLEDLRKRCFGIPLSVEFRHRGWASQETFDFLRQHELAFVCVDEPQFPSLMPPVAVATTDFAYLRFHGRNYQMWWKSGEEKRRYDYLYSEEELKEWLPKMEGLHAQSRRLFIFMNNHFGGKAVTNALMLEGMLQNRLGVAFPSATALPLAQAKLPIGPSF